MARSDAVPTRYNVTDIFICIKCWARHQMESLPKYSGESVCCECAAPPPEKPSSPGVAKPSTDPVRILVTAEKVTPATNKDAAKEEPKEKKDTSLCKGCVLQAAKAVPKPPRVTVKPYTPVFSFSNHTPQDHGVQRLQKLVLPHPRHHPRSERMGHCAIPPHQTPGWQDGYLFCP